MSNDVRQSPPNKKQNEESDFTGRLSKHLSEFMNNSTIHGLKYLVGDERTILEKILWSVVLLISVYTCSLMIKSTWQKWEENPIVIGFSQTPMRLSDIPFPALTICPAHGFNIKSNLTFSYVIDKNWTVGNVSEFCEIFENSDLYPRTEFQMYDFYEGTKWEQFLTNTAILSNQFLELCFFNSIDDCEELFSPILTEMGICYTINTLSKANLFRNATYLPKLFLNQRNISHWTFDKNYHKTNKSVYPRRSKIINDALTLFLNPELNKLACHGNNFYRAIVHHPAVTPSFDRAIKIENNKSYHIWIKPNVIVTSENLKNYSSYRKKCFFSDERYLQFYKIYTAANCKIECLANHTLSRCGCVPFYLPHNETTKICSTLIFTHDLCVQKTTKIMLELESELSENNLSLPTCNCLPSCNLVTYDEEVRVTDVPASIGIFMMFKDTEFIVLERQELFGDVNFWASCGGIIGLFTGFSVVSLAEIVYYLLLRWMYNLGRRFWREINPNRLMLAVLVYLSMKHV